MAARTPTRFGRVETFRALRYRDYRLLWLEQAITSTGQSMRVMVRGMLVYQMTNSPFWLGWVTSVVGIPALVMPFLGGILADRMDRRRLLVLMQWALTALWLAVAILILTGRIQIWHIVVSGLISGVLQAFSRPASAAMMPNLVPRQDLTNAIALNSTLMSVSSISGPSLGGLLVIWLGRGDNERGVGGVFVVTALAILVASLLVMMIRWEHRPTRAARESMASNLLEGMRFIRSDSAVLSLILLGFTSSFLISPYTFLMPIFALDILKVGPSGLGLLLSAQGFGALIGGLGLASFGGVRRKGRMLLAGTLIYCLLLLLFTQSRWFPVSFVLLACAGIMSTVNGNMNQNLLILAVPDEIRGRVLSTRMVSMGFMSIGSLWMGTVAELTSTPTAIALGIVLYASSTLGIFLMSPRLRRSEEWDPSLHLQAAPVGEAG